MNLVVATVIAVIFAHFGLEYDAPFLFILSGGIFVYWLAESIVTHRERELQITEAKGKNKK